MEYFKKALQSYEQYNIKPSISYTKGAINQMSLEEPILVIWVNELQGINITSYNEYIEYIATVNNRCNKSGIDPSTQMPKVIKIITENHIANDFMDIIMGTDGKEQLELLSNFDENRFLHSIK